MPAHPDRRADDDGGAGFHPGRGSRRRSSDFEVSATPSGIETHLPLDQLSMGMSGDFEEAIEEGATLVRIGSALFEGVAR